MFFFLDGAMGTEIIRLGVPASDCLVAQNLERPDVVASVHVNYRQAGADILSTNTFGANRFRLCRHGREDDLGAINLAGARLAREHAGGALVAGSIGPSGEQEQRPSAVELRSAFREQAQALETGGVDLFSLETFGDVAELGAAILGVRDVSDRPILAQVTYTPAGRTPLGLTPAEVVQALADLPVDALGVNCAIGEGTAAAIAEELHDLTSIPVVAQPNAGQPVARDGALLYPVGPDAFAEQAVDLSRFATVVGGCCGTTPAHIAAARARVTAGHG